MVKNKLVPFMVKLTADQRRALQLKANAFTDGNLSEWLRLAAERYQPEKGKVEYGRARQGTKLRGKGADPQTP